MVTKPDFSIIIPAFNEEALIADTLESVYNAMTATALAGEVIVVNNNSTDRTEEKAAATGARVVFEGINQISRARNTGARQATGRYLIFLDADTRLSGELLHVALLNLESGLCVGGGVCLAGDKKATPQVERAMNGWNKLSVRFRLAAGCFVYCLRDGFESVGGFNEKIYASEEIWLSVALKKWGKSKSLEFRIIEKPYIVTSLRKLDWYSNTQLAMQMALLFIPFALYSKRLCGFWYKRKQAA